MKYNSIYNKFTSGELSEYLKGRTDLEEYYSGVEEMTNFIPMRQGGAYFRPGTINMGLSTSFPSRIFKFNPTDKDSYIVIAAPGYSLSITRLEEFPSSCTLTTPLQIWNHHPDFDDVSSVFSPSNFNVLRSLTFTSYGDIFIICDGTGAIAPIVGKRTGPTTFTIDSLLWPTIINASKGVLEIDISAKYPIRVPYKDPNIEDNIRFKPSATSGNITITSQNAAATPINYFAGDVVGTLVKITHGTQTGVARIESKVSDSVVNAHVYVGFGAITATSNWQTSSFNPVDGYPRTACFHQGRLYLGGNIKQPDTLWASNVGNIYHFMSRRLAQDSSTDASGMNYFGATKDTDPFNFTLAATSANSIQWMFPSQTLLVGTTSQEYSISGGSDAILSVLNIDVAAISSHGSAKVNPVKVGSSILFVSRDRKRLLEIPKDLRQYQTATDLSSLSEGIIEKSLKKVTTSNMLTTIGIQEVCFQESEGIVWIYCLEPIDNKTTLLSLTIDRTTKALGWAKHTLQKTTNTPLKITGLCTVPLNDHGGRDFLHIMTDRELSNYTIERMWYRSKQTFAKSLYGFETVNSQTTTNHLDFATIITAVSDTVSLPVQFPTGYTFTLMDKNGEIIGDFLKTGATINIPGAASLSPMTGGYKYTGEIKTMPIEAGAQFGVAQGSSRRGHEISIFLDRTRGGKYKQSKSSNEYPIETTATASALKTGEVKLSLNASPDDTQTVLKQDLPYPMTVLWLLTKGMTYDT